jgi:hypothetical protein
MLPMQKDMRTMAFMAIFLVCPASEIRQSAERV